MDFLGFFLKLHRGIGTPRSIIFCDELGEQEIIHTVEFPSINMEKMKSSQDHRATVKITI